MSAGILTATSCSKTESRVPVRLSFTNTPFSYLPVIVAEGLGYYGENGLAVDIADFSAAAKAVQAMLGGSADVAAGTYEQVVSLAPEGRDVKAFTTMLVGATRLLIANPRAAQTIRRVEDLRGAHIGLASPGGPNHLFLNYVLARHGVSPQEVTIVSIGTNATSVAAIEHNRVDAAALNDLEYLTLRKRGIEPIILADARGREGVKRIFEVEEYPGTVLMARQRWLGDNPDTARRLVHAINKAVQWMNAQSPATVLAKLPARYRSDPEVDLAAITTVLPMFSKTGAMSAEGAEAVRRMLAVSVERVRTGNFDLSKTYTNEFVETR
jgi:NitT/TauT family transport system substrate-binding protein